MALPELVRKSAEKLLKHFCNDRLMVCPRGEVRLDYAIDGDCVTLFEERPAEHEAGKWLKEPVAQVRYSHEFRYWTLHYPGSDQRWRFYLNASPSLDLAKLLRQIEADPLQLFWR